MCIFEVMWERETRWVYWSKKLWNDAWRQNSSSTTPAIVLNCKTSFQKVKRLIIFPLNLFFCWTQQMQHFKITIEVNHARREEENSTWNCFNIKWMNYFSSRLWRTEEFSLIPPDMHAKPYFPKICIYTKWLKFG